MLLCAAMAMRDVLEQFADSTTMHGVPKVINSRSSMGRAFWSVVCIAAGSMFCLQMSEVLHRYFSYPKKVTVEVVPTPVPFPSISLCNMRNLDVYVLNTMNRMFLQDDHPYNHINESNIPFIKQYMSHVARYAPLFWKYQEQYAEVFQAIFSRTTFSANFAEEIISQVAVQLDGFVVNCHYAGHRCNRTRDFVKFFDPYYFNCFTYTAPSEQNMDDSLAEGIENGWSSILLTGSGMLDTNEEIRMMPGLHEWRSAISASEGLRVVIHPPNTEPYPFTEGYDVPPGFSASLGIRPRRNIRIGLPHGNCTQNNPFDKSDTRYRLMACQKMCLQNMIVQHCNCADIGLPKLPSRPDVLPCRNDANVPDKCMFEESEECLQEMFNLHDRITCARSTKAVMTKNTSALDECSCFPPCDEVSYDVSYSLSKWPSSGYEGDSAYYDVFGIEFFSERFNKTGNEGKFELFQQFMHNNSREDIMKNFARLNVYIADANVVKTQESADYTRNQLVSDIGGQLGLWVGISLITLAEVLQLFIDIIRFLSSYSYRKVPSRANAVRRNANGAVAQAPKKKKKQRNNNEDYLMSDYKRERLQNYNGFRRQNSYTTAYGNPERMFSYPIDERG